MTHISPALCGSPTRVLVALGATFCATLELGFDMQRMHHIESAWRPAASQEPAAPLPVMVYIFGGGLCGGSANVVSLIASRLVVRQQVIVVSVSYRLGDSVCAELVCCLSTQARLHCE